MRKADIATSLTMICVSGFFLIQTTKIKDASGAILGPRFFPYVVLTGIILLSLLVLFYSCRKEETSSKEVTLDFQGKAKVLVTLLIAFIYVALLEKLGFVFASVLFMSALGLFFYGKFDKKKVLNIFLFSAVAPVALFFLFTKFFHTLLP
ncbi:tripartite tricarboxylate transporter TctB family protein [Aminobacterium mobile]|uniref:tripartite tricarboxylate transporter TctB family protein n=1 Tax=Aminobacterium mobile TaxID=81467 RepID=UPI0004664641|nr:tripartite tricarboxylate transporter TctB family protein [Aminobacterium mobile]